MTPKLIAVFFIAAATVCSFAQADNSLSADQLMKSLQNSVKDCQTTQPDMSKSISGLRVTTIGTTAQVTLQMNSDGMSMSVKYVCAPQGADMACNVQQ